MRDILSYDGRVAKVADVFDVDREAVHAKRQALELRKQNATIEVEAINRDEADLVLQEQLIAEAEVKFPQQHHQAEHGHL